MVELVAKTAGEEPVQWGVFVAGVVVGALLAFLLCRLVQWFLDRFTLWRARREAYFRLRAEREATNLLDREDADRDLDRRDPSPETEE